MCVHAHVLLSNFTSKHQYKRHINQIYKTVFFSTIILIKHFNLLNKLQLKVIFIKLFFSDHNHNIKHTLSLFIGNEKEKCN
jgi:hypothetical protein